MKKTASRTHLPISAIVNYRCFAFPESLVTEKKPRTSPAPQTALIASRAAFKSSTFTPFVSPLAVVYFLKTALISCGAMPSPNKTFAFGMCGLSCREAERIAYSCAKSSAVWKEENFCVAEGATIL
jgi:hypothetical protein